MRLEATDALQGGWSLPYVQEEELSHVGIRQTRAGWKASTCGTTPQPPSKWTSTHHPRGSSSLPRPAQIISLCISLLPGQGPHC